jgi:hypothetical protein
MSDAREQQGDATNPEQPTVQELHARHEKSGGLASLAAGPSWARHQA